jgi:hypothetical protein
VSDGQNKTGRMTEGARVTWIMLWFFWVWAVVGFCVIMALNRQSPVLT